MKNVKDFHMKNPPPQVQYRHYETPPDSCVLPLLGAGRIRERGNDPDALHFHNCLELGYCSDGAGVMTFAERKIPHTKGVFSIIPPNYLHNTYSLPGEECHWEYLFVNVEGFLVKTLPNKPFARAQLTRNIHKEALLLKHEENTQIVGLILAIMDEFRAKADLYLESVNGLLQSLLICVARLDGGELAGTDAGKRLGAIAAGIDYVADHYSEKIAVSALAGACHISETHFRRLFSQTMRMSPLAYINLIRVEAACKLLFTTDGLVGDIAVKCGFISITALNRNFKAIVGMSPSQWRKDTQYYERLPNILVEFA